MSCGRFGAKRLPQSLFTQWLDGLLEVHTVDAVYGARRERGYRVSGAPRFSHAITVVR